MKEVLLKDFTIVHVGPVKRERMSDEEYFSEKYNYVSNSSLGLINPEQDGSPEKYLQGFKSGYNASFELGTAIHQLFLQSDEYVLNHDIDKPAAKLGATIQEAMKLRKEGHSIYNSIKQAAIKIGYYVKNIDSKISDIIKKGFSYYIKAKDLPENEIVVSRSDYYKIVECLKDLKNNMDIMNLFQAETFMFEPVGVYNEEAFFTNFEIEFEGKICKLPFKMKADNWTCNKFIKTVTLNDLKTTGKQVKYFMDPECSFESYHYSRQMGIYHFILKKYCEESLNADDSWIYKNNMMVVETGYNNYSQRYPVSDEQINDGIEEAFRLLKMVAYYTLHGWEKPVKFI